MFYNDELQIFYPQKEDDFFNYWNEKVNSDAFQPEEVTNAILPDPDLRCLYLHMALEWIRFHSERSVSENEDNKTAMRRIRRIAEMKEYQNLYSLYFDAETGYSKAADYFCQKAPSMNRKAMQTMTSFLFCVLANTNAEINPEMEEEYGQKWWSMN